MMILLSGCGKTRGSTNPEEQILQSMKEKYNITVEVEHIEEKTGVQAFQERFYEAAVVPKGSGEMFHVYLGKKSKNVADDYPRLLYDDMIRAFAEEEIDYQQNLDITSYNILYRPSEEKWTPEDGQNVFDYLSQSDTEIVFVIEMGSDDVQTAEDIYTFARSLEEKRIQFTLKVEKSGDTVFISSSRNSRLKRKERIISMLIEK